MRILPRYILGEIFGHALIGTALFTFVVFMRDVGRLMELVVRNSAPGVTVVEIFLFTLPAALTVTIPMGALVGILLGLSRLAADSEVTAMRASGIGTWAFVRIVAVFAIGAWLLASVNNVWLAPKAAAGLGRLQDRLKTSQASFEIQPRVFYEDFKNIVLYVEDVRAAGGVAVWRGVFLADVSTPNSPIITLARAGIIQQGPTPNEMRLHLEDGQRHEVQAGNAEQYTITQFQSTDIPIVIPSATQQSRETVSTAELPTPELWRLSRVSQPAQARWYAIEFHRRLAYPAACLVLALVGIPLGLSAKKGGKSTGFVITIVLVFVYYFVSLAGVALARQGKMSPTVGVWMANVAFGLAGLFLLWRSERRPFEIPWLRTFSWSDIRNRLAELTPALGEGGALERSMRRVRLFRTRFPQLLDDYVLREFLTYVGMVLAAFLLLTLVFTFFEILKDVLRNSVSMGTVGEYLLMVLPSMLYLMTPMSVLIAVLVTFGLMSRANEITAMKATGISIYRAVIPVLVMSAFIATGLFFFDQIYLPRFNKRQETLFNRIKGRPAQTYLNPGRKFIFGAHNDIYYYEFFDSSTDHSSFGNLSSFSFDPKTFDIRRRVSASSAHWEPRLQHWVFERGWVRNFNGTSIQGYDTFEARTFADLDEPPTYFKKEVKQSSEMNYDELASYIRDLQQSGFDVTRLKVQLQKKIAFPLITLVMAILAVPFSLSQGKRGALTGVAVAIGVAVVYWVTAGVFEALGNVTLLPPMLAAWAPDLLFAFGGGYLILKVPT